MTIENEAALTRLLLLTIEHRNPDLEVDFGKVAELLGYSSLQVVALLKSVNEEFGTDITFEDLDNIRGADDFKGLLSKISAGAC